MCTALQNSKYLPRDLGNLQYVNIPRNSSLSRTTFVIMLCQDITILFHTYNSFNGNFDGCISHPIYWSSLLDESCNSLAQTSQNEGLTAVWNKDRWCSENELRIRMHSIRHVREKKSRMFLLYPLIRGYYNKLPCSKWLKIITQWHSTPQALYSSCIKWDHKMWDHITVREVKTHKRLCGGVLHFIIQDEIIETYTRYFCDVRLEF